VLLIREAGGYISGLRDGRHDVMATGDVVAANDHLHLPLTALLKDAMKGPGSA
jgi:myo-inositol-1(or 4)-monophosphatase